MHDPSTERAVPYSEADLRELRDHPARWFSLDPAHCVRSLLATIDALRAGGEPVAWGLRGDLVPNPPMWIGIDKNRAALEPHVNEPCGVRLVPLYASPPAPSWAKGARDEKARVAEAVRIALVMADRAGMVLHNDHGEPHPDSGETQEQYDAARAKSDIEWIELAGIHLAEHLAAITAERPTRKLNKETLAALLKSEPPRDGGA